MGSSVFGGGGGWGGGEGGRWLVDDSPKGTVSSVDGWKEP